VQRVTCDRVLSVVAKDGSLAVHMKPDARGTAALKLECDKLAQLEAALRPVSSGQAPRKRSLAMSRVLPSLRLNYSVHELQSDLTQIIDRLLTTLESHAGSIPAIIDIFSCVYKVRFQGGDPRSDLVTLSAELSLRLLLHWTAAIRRAVALVGVTHDYVSRIVVNLANTIAVVADPLDIDAQQLVAASIFFYDERNGGGVADEGEKIAKAIRAKLAISRDGPADYLTDRLYDMTILAVVGRLLNVYIFDIEQLRDACVERALGESTKTEEQDEAMNRVAKIFIGDVLRRMNDKRFDPIFQYLFAIWPLKDSKCE
jgi:hypothetical protein